MNVQGTRSPVGHMDENFFAHPLEKRTAIILDRRDIRYIYRFRVTVKKKGEIVETEIDFFLINAVNIRGYGLVKYIENKNKMNDRAKEQQALLKDNGYETLIVTSEMVEDFEKNGFLEERCQL
jgi:thioredoxin-related protein